MFYGIVCGIPYIIILYIMTATCVVLLTPRHPRIVYFSIIFVFVFFFCFFFFRQTLVVPRVRQMVQAQRLSAPAHPRRMRQEAPAPVQHLPRVLLSQTQPEDPFHQ